jgi:hypothetical protein
LLAADAKLDDARDFLASPNFDLLRQHGAQGAANPLEQEEKDAGAKISVKEAVSPPELSNILKEPGNESPFLPSALETDNLPQQTDVPEASRAASYNIVLEHIASNGTLPPTTIRARIQAVNNKEVRSCPLHFIRDLAYAKPNLGHQPDPLVNAAQATSYRVFLQNTGSQKQPLL